MRANYVIERESELSISERRRKKQGKHLAS
jgi:hypothetical protein